MSTAVRQSATRAAPSRLPLLRFVGAATIVTAAPCPSPVGSRPRRSFHSTPATNVKVRTRPPKTPPNNKEPTSRPQATVAAAEQPRPKTTAPAAPRPGAGPVPVSVSEAAARLNPPTSTLPPPLDLPENDPQASQFKQLLAKGKAYLAFYKTGLKAVWSNYRAARAIIKKSYETALDAGNIVVATELPTSLFSRVVGHPPPDWTRAEYLMVRRARHDMLRLPIFALLVLVFEEFTPFVVLFFSRVVPLTCRIPRQVAEDEGKTEGRRLYSFEWMEIKKNEEEGKLKGVELLDRETAKTDFLDMGYMVARAHVMRGLGVISPKWDSVLGYDKIPLGSWYFRGLPRMFFLESDDEFLRRGGVPSSVVKWRTMSSMTEDTIAAAIKGLSDIEVRLACKERGIDVTDRAEKDMRKDLVRWLWLTAGRDEMERRRRISAILVRRKEAWPKNRDFATPKWFL